VGANSELSIAYAGSKAMSGDHAERLAQLKSLEQANPNIPLVHYLLGTVYAGDQNYGQAADEFRVSLKLDPSSMETTNALALADVALGLKPEALQLFSELAQSGSQDGDVYHRLAQLQMESGSIQDAISSLKTAIQLDPTIAAYHRDLADAYQKNAQPDEAERESRMSEVLQAGTQSSHPPENVN
jgi:Flp pilus assembly protein TadD